jgi:hypothetical protein
VNRFERGSRGFLALFRHAQSAVMQRAAIAAFGFDDSVSSWACGGGIEAKDANALRVAGFEHGSKSKACEKWKQRS